MSDYRLYEEQMTASELSFLKKKKERDLVMFRKTVRVLAIFCMIIPFFLGVIMESFKRELHPDWYQNEDADPYSFLYYFFGFLFLLVLLALGSYYSYVNTLKKIADDIQYGKKVIEQTHITRKWFMQQNQSYHFYLNSSAKLSIEVNAADFQLYEEGDEINIEYSPYSKTYFGYF